MFPLQRLDRWLGDEIFECAEDIRKERLVGMGDVICVRICELFEGSFLFALLL